MTRCSTETKDQIFVKGYGFLSFTKNVSKNIGESISKNLSGKYSQKLVYHDKQYSTDPLKTTSKRANPKTAEATGDLIGNKIADKITNVSRNLPQNSSETVIWETENIGLNREIPKKRYISPEKR